MMSDLDYINKIPCKKEITHVVLSLVSFSCGR